MTKTFLKTFLIEAIAPCPKMSEEDPLRSRNVFSQQKNENVKEGSRCKL